VVVFKAAEKNNFEFEAEFIHEAFIHHSKEYINNPKRAYIEIAQ